MSSGPDFSPTAGFAALPAPAKINLFLHVIGQRPDGYHELQTAFQLIDYYDYLSFRRREDGQIRVHMSQNPEIPQADNLIYQAARRLQHAQGVRYGADIYCDKHIPAGAGLGGGSSNAATTLIALNRLWQTQLTRSQLMQLGLELGADVPVFIFGQPAFAEGVGERLTATPAWQGPVLLVTPEVFISTKQVFSHPDLTRDTKEVSIICFTEWLKTYGSDAGFESDCFGRNDLQAVAFKLHPELARLAHRLKMQDVDAKLSGSGSSLFALKATAATTDRQSGKVCDRILSELLTESDVGVCVRICHGLTEHPLRTWLD